MSSIADRSLYGVGSDQTSDLFMVPAIGGGLDVPVTDVCVAQRHLHLGVAEQTRHHGQRNALHRRLASKRMTYIMYRYAD